MRRGLSCSVNAFHDPERRFATLPLVAEALLTHPETVQHIHEDYIEAGAQIIITNTFRTTRRAFAKLDIADKAQQAATILACHLVQQAIEHVKPEHEVYIAGSIAPLEDCYSPELSLLKPGIIERTCYVRARSKVGWGRLSF